MKLSKLIDPQFQSVLRKLAAQEIPLRTAFMLKGIIKLVNEELNKYDEVKSEALNRLGEKGEDGQIIVEANGNVKLSDENMKLLVSEMNALLASDVNVGSLKVGDLGNKVALSANELMSLDELITE